MSNLKKPKKTPQSKLNQMTKLSLAKLSLKYFSNVIPHRSMVELRFQKDVLYRTMTPLHLNIPFVPLGM